MPTLTGAGRLLGNLYSRTGSSLERRLGKLAYRAGFLDYAKAWTLLFEFDAVHRMIVNENRTSRTIEVHAILFQYARCEVRRTTGSFH